MIVPAEEAVLPQSELVAGLEPLQAGAAPKALHMIDLRLGSHHVIVFAEALATLVAFRAEQPATRTRTRTKEI